ncbi:hypothetical protein AB0F13_14550 [Streptomyces sp. NPDC026206]|uniref:hypothetical protein n=1 Tax=Streptomyces sp. NPDC026206 TaxID=3157089 RepID=UPI0033C22FB6
MSDPQTDIHSPDPVPADLSEAIRAEAMREYADQLAQAEFRAQAAETGAEVPNGFVDYLDTSKLLGEDGRPSAEAIAKALEPFKSKKPEFPQLMGVGYYRGSPAPSSPRVSLDVRKR